MTPTPAVVVQQGRYLLLVKMTKQASSRENASVVDLARRIGGRKLNPFDCREIRKLRDQTRHSPRWTTCATRAIVVRSRCATATV